MIYNNKKDIDYLAGSKPSHCIPSDTPIEEMLYYVVESMDNDFNEMMMTIGINELDYFVENGVELEYGPLNEADIKDTLKNKAAAFKQKSKDILDAATNQLKSAWQKAQEMIQAVLKAITERAKSVRDSIKDKIYGGIKDRAMSDAVKSIKDDKDFGDTFEYSGMDHFLNRGFSDFHSRCNDATDRFMVAVASHQKNDPESIAQDISELSKDLNDDIDDVIAQLSESRDNKGISDMKKSIKDKVRGKSIKMTGKWLKAHWNNISKEIESFPDAKKKLNKTYDEVKKIYNDAIKHCKDDASKLENNKIFNASAFIVVTRANNKMMKAVMAAEDAVVECINERFRTQASIVLRVSASAKVANRIQHNSAMMESSSSTVDALNSLFEW